MDPYGHSAEWLARVCKVDLSTARRWKRQGQVPSRYHSLLDLAAGADLGALCRAWRGWRLVEGQLINAEGEGFLPGQVRAIGLNAQRIAELERRLARIVEAAPRRTPRELVLRVRLEDELEGAAAGIVSVAHLELTDSPN